MTVEFAADATLEQIDVVLGGVDAWRKVNIQAALSWIIGIPTVQDCEELDDILDQLQASALVVEAGKNGMATGAVVPNDPFCDSSYQWGLWRMNLPTAWGAEQGKGAYATVGIVDTGVLQTHTDLAAHVVASDSPGGSQSSAWHLGHRRGCRSYE